MHRLNIPEFLGLLAVLLLAAKLLGALAQRVGQPPSWASWSPAWSSARPSSGS